MLRAVLAAFFLGETWVSHWGKHRAEATQGVLEASAKGNPLLNGVTEIFGTTDVYEAAPPADSTILVRGQVVAGMEPGSPPADYVKKEPCWPGAGRECTNDARRMEP